MPAKQEKSVFIAAVATALVLGGLFVTSLEKPAAAIPASGFALALLFHFGHRYSKSAADLLGGACMLAAMIANPMGWPSIVFIPALILALVWIRLHDQIPDPDDRVYLPALMAALGWGALFFVRRYFLKLPGGLLEIGGLTGIMEWFGEAAREGAEGLTGDTRKEYLSMIRELMEKFPYYYFGVLVVLFSITQTFTSRLLSRGREPLQPLLFFKIKERYVFLLIFAMGIEIFRYLFDQKELLYISRSFLFFLGFTYFIAGLAVLGFLLLKHRLRAGSFLSRWLFLLLFFLIIIKPIICAAIGLLDIWFDFRRLKILQGGFGR